MPGNPNGLSAVVIGKSFIRNRSHPDNRLVIGKDILKIQPVKNGQDTGVSFEFEPGFMHLLKWQYDTFILMCSISRYDTPIQITGNNARQILLIFNIILGSIMQKIIITATLLFSSAFPQSEELSTGLGVSGGLLTGSGLSYRHVGDNSGWQLTFGIISFPDDYSNDYIIYEQDRQPYQAGDWIPDTTEVYRSYDYNNGGTWANVGLLYLKPLHRSKTSMFYILGGASAYYSSSTDYFTNYQYVIDSDTTYSYVPVGDRTKERTTDVTFRVGIGIGLEYNITENIRLSLDLPLTIADDRRITMLFPDAGLYYYFK